MSLLLEPSKEQIKEEKLYQQMGVSDDEFALIESIIGRLPNYTEIGIFSVMWSEHCSYKNSKPVLRKFPTSGERVLQGPGEGAGIVDIGDNQAVVFKIESHNHPSAIEPYQGAATGVGGIIRDVFSMGARPIAVLNSLRFGELTSPRVKYLFEEVVAGIAGYGNCIGIPTVGGEVQFDASYEGNPLVNAMCVGLIDHKDIKKARRKVSATRSCTSALKRAATAYTALLSHQKKCQIHLKKNVPRCRSAILSWKNFSWKHALKSSNATP